MFKTPQDRLRLARGVGDGLPNRSEDVAALASALDHFGRYNAKEEQPLAGRSQLDWKLDNALRGFQRSFGLKPDGRVLPGGPTANTLNTLMAGGLSALMLEPPRHRTRGDLRSRLKLEGSVGEDGDNAAGDRTWVRVGLGVMGHLPLGQALDDALDDRAMADGIQSMHRRMGLGSKRQVRPRSQGEELLRNAALRAFAAESKAEGERLRAIKIAGSEGDPGRHTGVQIAQSAETEGDEELRPSSEEMDDRAYPQSILPLYDTREDQARWGGEDWHFYNALEATLEHEAGWNDADNGTWRGVTQDFYDAFKNREKDNPTYKTWPRYVGNLKEDQIHLLYRYEFWRWPRLYKLLEVDGLSTQSSKFVAQVFDFGVNTTPLNAKKIMQEAINQILTEEAPEEEFLVVDGIIGARTLGALSQIVNRDLVKQLNNLLVDMRVDYYERRSPSDVKKGLIARAEQYREPG